MLGASCPTICFVESPEDARLIFLIFMMASAIRFLDSADAFDSLDPVLFLALEISDGGVPVEEVELLADFRLASSDCFKHRTSLASFWLRLFKSMTGFEEEARSCEISGSAAGVPSWSSSSS